MAPATAEAHRRLDHALVSGPWLLIGPDNRGVGHVRTVEQAEEAVRSGRAATWAGQVRPHVLAIDLDLDDSRMADYLVEEVTGWCQRRDLWHVTVESGGGPGRRHLFVLPERFSAELHELLDLLRRERRLSTRHIDERRVIRPPSAPHRTGARRGRLPAVATPTLPRQPHERAHSHRTNRPQSPEPTRTGTVTSRGRRLAERVPESGDRSLDEFLITRALHDAGETEEDTWALIRSRNGHSANHGRAWWHRYMWSAIRPAAPTEGTGSQRTDIARVILPTVAVMRTRYGDLDTRKVHTIETVWWALAERIQDAPVGRVPVSQRDLYLVTGIDHRAARAATRWLVETGFLTEHRGVRRDDAIEWSFGPETITSLTASPKLSPRAATWAGSCPKGTATLVLTTHLTGTPPEHGSTRQRTLHRARTQAARTHHLLPGPPTRHPHTPPVGWRQRLAQITAERDQFYTRLRAHRAAKSAAWHAERTAILAANRHRQRCWWNRLSPAEQEARRTQRRRWLTGLPTSSRRAHLGRLRNRREPRHDPSSHVSLAHPYPIPHTSQTPYP